MFFLVSDIRFPASFPIKWDDVGVPNTEAISQPVQIPVKIVAYKTTK